MARPPRFHVTVPPDAVPPLSAETNVVPFGTGSLTTTPVAFDGPEFWTAIAYVRSVPAPAGSDASDFDTLRSAATFTAVGSVSESFAGFGSTTPELTEAVSESGVVREGSTWTVNAMLAEAPFAREPSEHVTVPAATEQVPWDGEAET